MGRTAARAVAESRTLLDQRRFAEGGGYYHVPAEAETDPEAAGG